MTVSALPGQVDRPPQLRILYLVPDLTDPAVERRVGMLRAGGASVELAGFHRRPWPGRVPGVTAMGQTEDANLRHRAGAVAAWIARPLALSRLARSCDVIIARNLEMLTLGRLARRLCGDRPTLVYECLDVHAAMLGRGQVTRALRLAEGGLLRGCRGLLVSSPAFVTQYFARVHPAHPPVTLIENKPVRLTPQPCAARRPRVEGDPWRIGWFGMIRCRKSLELLQALAAAVPGRVEVLIRGRPTPAVFPDFAGSLMGHPQVRFEGPYVADDLARLYGDVDFAWGMDFYEAGQNSSWLLPNRLYESGAFDVPLLAQAGVETARWLERVRSGVIFSDPATELAAYFRGLDESDYAALRQKAERVPRTALICDAAACQSLVEGLRP